MKENNINNRLNIAGASLTCYIKLTIYVSFMLDMLTHLLGRVSATDPLNLCLQTPGPFSLEVRVFSCPAIYLITFLRLEELFWSESCYFPTLAQRSSLSANCSSVISRLQLTSEREIDCACSKTQGVL